MPERALLQGARAAEGLLQLAGYQSIAKVENPIRRRTFDRIVARISTELADAAYDLDVGFIDRLLSALDVDFQELTAGELGSVFARARAALPDPARYVPRIVPLLGAELEGIALASRGAAVSGQRGAGGLSAADREVLAHLQGAQGFYIQNAMTARNARIETRIAAVIDRAARLGMSRAEVRAALEEVVGEARILREQATYFDIVAGDVSAQARTLGMLTRYRDAGISFYIWESILDEVTSDQCRFLHGTVFRVDAGMQTLAQMASTIDGAKEAAPWLRVGRNADGEKVLYTKSMSHRREIATVVRSGVGIKDDVGEFRTSYDADALSAVGICLPPAHANCRSTIVAGV